MHPVTKFLLFLILSIVTAVGLLWYSGGSPIEFQSAITISAPGEKIFRCLLDPNLRPQWVTGLQETGLVSAAQPGLLSEYQSQYQVDGRSFTAEERIQNWVQNQYLVIRRRDEQWEWMTVFQLESTGKQTQLEYTARLTPLGIQRIWFAFYRATEQQLIEQELLEIKKLAESLPDDKADGVPAALVPDVPPEN
jgi:uncharacterized protein YndB with AHSA1/START domain